MHDGTERGLLVTLSACPLPREEQQTRELETDPDDPSPRRPTNGTRTAWCVDHERMVPEAEWDDHEVCEMREHHPNASRGAAPIGAGDITSMVTRYTSSIDGLDRCLGGGLVKGTRVLLTGDPGTGKSTLTLMALNDYARRGIQCMYITGEEKTHEVELRFRDLGFPFNRHLILYATESWESARAEIDRWKPRIILLDSLQRVRTSSCRDDPGLQSAAIMAATDRVVSLPWHPSMVVIGHINARGEAYGAMADRHDVTVHLHFSPDAMGRSLLRTKKNRHGPRNEVALFEFPPNSKRLREVPDISETLLQDAIGRPGVVAYPAVTKSFARALVIPVETSVSPPKGPNEPRLRNAQGVPDGMLADALDRLTDREVRFTDRSVRLQAPTVGEEVVADGGALLAVCAALVSSSESWGARVGVFGSLSAAGRVQPDPQVEQRLQALVRASVPLVYGPPLGVFHAPEGLEYVPVEDLAALVEHLKARAAFDRVQALRPSRAATESDSPGAEG